MKIRTSLTLTFFIIVIVILSAVSISIYFFSADYREQEFYMRLKNKAVNTAKLLIEVEEVSPELLRRIERGNPINLPNERISIYNFKNEELYSTDTGDVLPVTDELLNRIRLEGDVRFRFNDYEVLGFLFVHEYDRFTVVAAATDIYGFKKIENLKKILLIVFVISLFLISITGWIYAGHVLSPISNIVDEVDKISGSSMDRRLKVGNKIDELGKLATTFNLMLDRLEGAFLAQKNFIANASHELRTPITALAGEIEVTLLQPRKQEEYVNVLNSLLEDTRNLSSLSTQLLLLAHTSSANLTQRFTCVRVDELLWEAKEEVIRTDPAYNVQIQFDISLNDEALIIRGDSQLVKTVFVNLLDNGCKYAYDKTVSVTLKSTRQRLIIEFQNRGIGVPPTEVSTIFHPFIRGSNTGSIKGFGIGLSLADGIMKLHDGTIEVQSAGEVARFITTFPNKKGQLS
jgi:signal transduction histidine kinase